MRQNPENTPGSSLSDVRDQVGRVLDAGREPDRGAQIPIFVRRINQCARGSKAEGDKFTVSNAANLFRTAMEKLFQPFFGTASAIAARALGLGPDIASQIAQAHGGRIEVTSTADETRFVFRMPLTLFS